MNVTEEPAAAFDRTCGEPGPGPVLLGLLLSVVTLVTVVGNLLTVLAFLTDRSLGSKPSTYFILSLSCADLLIGLAMPVRIGEAICSHWPFGEIGCELQVFFNDVSVVAGMASMTAIALDRYLLISRDYPRYLELQSRRRVLATIGLIWTMALGCALLEVVVWEAVDWESSGSPIDFDEECLSPPRSNAAFALTIFVTVFLLPIGGVVGLSLRFLVLLRRRLRKDFGGPASSSPTGTGTGTERKESLGMSSAAPTDQTRLGSVSSSSSAPANAEEPASPEADASERAPGPPGTAADVGEAGVERRPSLSAENSRAEPAARREEGRRAARAGNATRDRYVRPAIIMGTLVTAFLLFSVPYLIFISVVVQLCAPCYHHSVQFHFVNVLFFNSCVNPFLYAATHPKIRRSHLNLLGSLMRFLTCRRNSKYSR